MFLPTGMMLGLKPTILVFLFAAVSVTDSFLTQGEACWRDGKPGVCTSILKCSEAMATLKQKRPAPFPCYITPKGEPYVCCVSSMEGAVDASSSSTTTTQAPQPASSLQAIQATETPRPTPTQGSLPMQSPQPTPSQQPTQAAQGTPMPEEDGSLNEDKKLIALRKCREYAELVYTLERSPVLLSNKSFYKKDNCVKSAEGLIVGGDKALLGEFPHMALLGYGNNTASLSYLCGGSLISEDFVLTAAHCMAPTVPTYVLLGELILKDTRDRAKPQLIPVSKQITHPRYTFSSYYFDIALIQLQDKPKLGPLVRPGCLHVGSPIPENSLTATGWGTTDYAGETSDRLLKVSLSEALYDRCNTIHSQTTNKLTSGILIEQQICAGRAEGGKDTCQGDSGGPLQIYSRNPHCTYEIVGVTSFGIGCGLKNTPGVYSRVEYFVGWIVDNVWPSES